MTLGYIETEQQYDEAVKELEVLINLEGLLDQHEELRLRVLEMRLHHYDCNHFRFDEPTYWDMAKYLLEQWKEQSCQKK